MEATFKGHCKTKRNDSWSAIYCLFAYGAVRVFLFSMVVADVYTSTFMFVQH